MDGVEFVDGAARCDDDECDDDELIGERQMTISDAFRGRSLSLGGFIDDDGLRCSQSHGLTVSQAHSPLIDEAAVHRMVDTEADMEIEARMEIVEKELNVR